MYGPSAKLAGATVRSAEPGPGLSFDLDRVLAAITPATRFVVLSNPNNPAGEVIPESSLLALARALPAGAFLFVDEAYADFAGNCAISAIATEPNLIVGRTFAKAYGLAGIRIGAVFARPEVIARLRGAIPPFSVNVFAVAALEAALKDRGYLEWYLHQVTQAKYVLYEGFSRLGLPFWRSAGNFVLVRVGDAPGVRQALSERGIHVRDRSSAPGCEGCIRVTAGLPDEARACVAALEEVLCAARR
jgi:histidinol-phosphate aminotransferase